MSTVDEPDMRSSRPSRTTLITDHDLQTAHVVWEQQLASMFGGANVQGVCGRVFLPAALTAPVGKSCPLCLAVTRTPQRRVALTERVVRAVQAWFRR